MNYEPPLEKISVNIREAVLGQGEKAVNIGGENTLPFHSFEGSLPNSAGLALEVPDMQPDNWAPSVLEPYEDVISDPVKWAKKCVEVYGAEMLCLRLLSTDPMGKDGSAEEAAEITKKVTDAVDVPFIVWGTDMEEKEGKEPLWRRRIAWYLLSAGSREHTPSWCFRRTNSSPPGTLTVFAPLS